MKNTKNVDGRDLEPTRVGPVGTGGEPFDDLGWIGETGQLQRLVVWVSESIVDVTSIHGGREVPHVEQVEGAATAVELSGDPLVGISGVYAHGPRKGSGHFVELTFHKASGARDGPIMGLEELEGERFELFAPEGQVVVALFGSVTVYDEGVGAVSALGLWTAPREALRVEQQESFDEASEAPSPAQEAELTDETPAAKGQDASETSDDPSALRLPGYRSDAVDPDATDLLGIQRDVDALCLVIASQRVAPPLSVGLFGDWGAGKSFFMAKLRGRVDELAEHADGGVFCPDVVHVEFNAWHFADANLWASLVSHIYDRLFEKIGGRSEEDKLRESITRQIEEAKGAKDDALEQLRAAQAELDAAQAARAQAEEEYDEFVGDMTVLLGSKPELGVRLDAAGKALGVAKLAGSYETLVETAQSLRSLSTRGAAVGRMFLGSPLTMVAIPVLVLTLVVPSALDLLLERFSGALGWLDAFATKLGATVSAAALWVSAQVTRASKHVGAIEAAYEEAREQREQRKAQARERPELERYEEVLAKEGAAREALEAARAKAQELERQLAEHDPRRRLERLIEARATGDEYRRHLGLISAIRKDFETMSRALAPSPSHSATPPSGGMRIILYIDDLDRCRPQRVVEVLEAVHLLLAFPLFVVVVAVDPRWLRLCLQSHYPELLGEAAGQSGGRTSTPQDYLEKIFQIPFALRKVSGAGFAPMVRDLLGPVAAPIALAAGSVVAAAPARAPVRPAASLAPPASQAVTPSRVSEGAGELEDAGTAMSAARPERASDPADDDAPARLGSMLRASRQLEFTASEHRDIMQLGRLFTAPRSVKRFINIYRLIRVRVEPHEFERFIGQEEYRVALVMLAVVTAFPNHAARFLTRLNWWLPKKLERDALTSWEDFMHTLERPQSELEALDGLEREALERGLAEPGEPAPSTADRHWRVMCARLRGGLEGMPMAFPEHVLERWAREVARYSFSLTLADLV